MKALWRKTDTPEKNYGLTEAQTAALLEEWERRYRNLVEKWSLCPNRRCRRRKRCLGPVFVCMRETWMRPPTKREDQRLLREFRRRPMRGLSAV